jgi:hypothetical protein
MANRGNTWSVPAGESDSFTVTITGDAGPIVGQYDGTEPLPLVVWAGGNLAPINGIASASWLDPAAGTVQVGVGPPPSMAAGYCRIRCSVTYRGATAPYYFGWIKVEQAPGTAAEGPVYGSYQDLADLAGDWLDRLMQGGAGDQTNFLKERMRARSWLDDIIVGASRVYAYNFDITYALFYGSFPFGPVESPDVVLTNYLASDFLQIVPRTVECTAYKALAYICEKRVTFDAEGEQYHKRALYYHRRASNSLRSYRPTLDTDGDGKPDIAFNLGTLSFR